MSFDGSIPAAGRRGAGRCGAPDEGIASVAPPAIGVADPRELELDALGPRIDATGGAPFESALTLYDDGHVHVGVWECTPGSFPSARNGVSETMTFVAGDATLVDDGGTRHHVGPGVALHVPDGWRGSWEIRETVRKVFVVARSPSAS